MQLHYLEIVTPDVAAVCATYEAALQVQFGEPVAVLGGARTAPLPQGGFVGVRAPLHGGERAVIRPYALVENIESAVAAAVSAGAVVAVPPMPLPGYGSCAIYFQGGIEHGLWQL